MRVQTKAMWETRKEIIKHPFFFCFPFEYRHCWEEQTQITTVAAQQQGFGCVSRGSLQVFAVHESFLQAFSFSKIAQKTHDRLVGNFKSPLKWN